MSRFTVLIPVHNEAANIAPLHAELVRELRGLDHEIIVINDGSTDTTGDELKRHAPEWTVINTARIGKSRALQTGLAQITTDRVVMIDGDLQDDSTAIPALLKDLDDGADCAVGCRAGRKDGWLIKRFPSFFFNLYLSLLFGFRFLDINTGLKAFRTDALQRIVWFENCHRFFPLLVLRQGGRVTQRATRHRARHAGEAKFNSPLRFLGGFYQGILLLLGRHDGLPATARLARLIPLLAALLVGASCLHWAAQEWYFANYDAPAFVPPMLSYARDGSLVNTFADTARLWDPQGFGRQVGHGFLPSIFTGALSIKPTYQHIHYVIAAQILLSLLVYVRLLGRVSPVRPPRVWSTAFLHTLAIIGAGYILINLEGRPEIFVFLVVATAAWLFLSLDVLGRLITAGVTLSILAVAHPIAAILTGLAFIAYLCVTRIGGTTWSAWGIAATATTAGVILWFSLYPYSVIDWVHGHLTHANSSIAGFPSSPITPWLLNPAKGLRGLLFFIVLGVAFWQLFRNRSRIARPILLTACVVVFMALVWYFALRQAFPVYNIDWITPFGLVLVFSVWWRLRKPAAQLAVTALITLALLPALGCFIAEQFLRNERLHSGPSPDEVRTLVQALNPRADFPGLLSGQYFHLFDNHSGLHRVSKHFASNPTLNPAFILVAQADIRRATPATRPGWRIAYHTYDSRPPKVPGLPLDAPHRGFHYALYLPEGTPASPALNAFLNQVQASGRESKASNQ